MDDLDQSTQGMPDDNIDIGDVIEVIETDPDYSQQKQQRTPVTTMFNGGEMGQARPRCVIVEEPAQKQLRFRYECEGRSAGSIPGANSTPENKTYPTIKVEGYRGKAVVVVSCVTKDEPFRPHPHKLVGREGCKKGVCTVNIPEDTMTVSFQNLGIQCVKKKDIEEALRTREEIRVDPFRTGFSHRASPTSIDLNAVRLCFQVFLQETRGRYTDLAPVVSNPIYDKKAMSDLVIVKLSDSVCPVDGGNKDIILLCEKVTKEDIQVRFYEEQNGKLIWEGFGEFQPSQVHKQTAISFRPPRYRTLEVIEPVKMFIQLKRPSDGAVSSAVPFQMVSLGNKRRAESTENTQNKRLFVELQNSVKTSPLPEMDYFPPMNIPVPSIKDEPREISRSPYQFVDQITQSPHHYPPNFYNIPPPTSLPSTSTSRVMLPDPQVAVQFSDSEYQLGLIGNTTTILNMDINQITLESGDLAMLNDITNNLSSNLSLTDLTPLVNDGMTDSLDRLANTEVDKHLAAHLQQQQ